MNLATDDLNKSGIFKSWCIGQSIVVIVLPDLRVLPALVYNLIGGRSSFVGSSTAYHWVSYIGMKKCKFDH